MWPYSYAPRYPLQPPLIYLRLPYSTDAPYDKDVINRKLGGARHQAPRQRIGDDPASVGVGIYPPYDTRGISGYGGGAVAASKIVPRLYGTIWRAPSLEVSP